MIQTMLFVLLAVVSDGTTPGYRSPDEMTLAQLEASFGKNALVEDPRGFTYPEGTDYDAVVYRHFDRNTYAELNGLISMNANLADTLLAHCALDIGVRHRDDPDQWAPGIADFATVSDDREVVTIRLRPGITWQFPALDADDPRRPWLAALYAEGAPEVTAEDYRFTLAAIQDKEVGSGYRSYYDNATIRTLGRYTFQIVWDEFYVYSLEMVIGFPQLLPEFLYGRDEAGHPVAEEDIGRGIADHWYNSRLLGYGPYEYVKTIPNEEIVIRRKEDFTPLRPAIKEIHWIAASATAAAQRQVDGQLDFQVFLPDTLRKWVTEGGKDSPFNNGTIKTKSYEKLEYMYLGWNCRKPPFDDVHVRRAMTMAFNGEGFLKSHWGGHGERVNSHVLVGHSHRNTDLVPIPFSLDDASSALDDAGWGDANGDGVRDKEIDGAQVDLAFDMSCFVQADSPEMFSMMEVYREDLASIGVQMTLRPLPYAELMDRLGKFDFDAYTGLWGLGWNVDFTNMFSTDGIRNGRNYVGFSDPEVDELSERYVRGGITDDAARKAIAYRIQERIYEEQPYTFFMRRSRFASYSPWIHGMEFAPVRPQLLTFPWYVLEMPPR